MSKRHYKVQYCVSPQVLNTNPRASSYVTKCGVWKKGVKISAFLSKLLQVKYFQHYNYLTKPYAFAFCFEYTRYHLALQSTSQVDERVLRKIQIIKGCFSEK